MSAVFHVIDREEWERSAHFDYYYRQVKARYNISSDVDITALLDFRGEHGLKFFPVMLYAIMRAVNRNREFRMGFDEEGRLGYWDEVVPSYTLFHPEDNTFTDVWSEYDSGFGTFYRTVTGDMERYGKVRGVIKARPGQPRNFVPCRVCRGSVLRRFRRIPIRTVPSCFRSSGSAGISAAMAACGYRCPYS